VSSNAPQALGRGSTANVAEGAEERLQELAALLVDDVPLLNWRGTGPDERDLWRLAEDEGVGGLRSWRVLRAGGPGWRGTSRQAARETLARATVLEEIRRRELVRVTRAFAGSRIRTLLLKGAAWAYTIYPAPALRPRLDTDLFVDAADRDGADRLLASLGYRPAVESVMELASAQRHYDRVGDHGVEHFVDLHWRVTNPLAFADALPFGRLWERSAAIPSLDGARILGATDALMLACLHRLAHHGDGSMLRWLMDIHLLAGAFRVEDWDDFVGEARTYRLGAVCAQSLARASERFNTRVPARVGRCLAEAPSTVERVFLGHGVSPLGVFISDWRAVGTWTERMRLLRDHVCPAPSYMRSRYGPRHATLLPVLYAHRALRGLARWWSNHRDWSAVGAARSEVTRTAGRPLPRSSDAPAGS
jgi:hypothetical protein